MRKCTLITLFAGGLVWLAAAETAQAQVYYGRGGRGGASFGVYTPGFSATYGRPYYGQGYGYGRGFYQPYYGGSYGYNPYQYRGNQWYGSYYSTPRIYSAPSNFDYVQTGQPQTYQSFYPATAPDNRATVKVILADPTAQVWFDGQLTQQQGPERVYASPPLGEGTFTYAIKATWQENGKTITREQEARVQANQETVVRFPPPDVGTKN